MLEETNGFEKKTWGEFSGPLAHTLPTTKVYHMDLNKTKNAGNHTQCLEDTVCAQ